MKIRLRARQVFGKLCAALRKWSRRLTVRTPGFHPSNRSSTLLGTANEEGRDKRGLSRLLGATAERAAGFYFFDACSSLPILSMRSLRSPIVTSAE